MQRVVSLAVRVVVEDGLPYGPSKGHFRTASWHLWRDHGLSNGHFRVFIPFATIQNWVEAGGEWPLERPLKSTGPGRRWVSGLGTAKVLRIYRGR